MFDVLSSPEGISVGKKLTLNFKWLYSKTINELHRLNYIRTVDKKEC